MSSYCKLASICSTHNIVYIIHNDECSDTLHVNMLVVLHSSTLAVGGVGVFLEEALLDVSRLILEGPLSFVFAAKLTDRTGTTRRIMM